MVQRGHLPLMIGTDCQVDYALSQDNEAGLLKAAYQPPQPVVLYLGMSKHSPSGAAATAGPGPAGAGGKRRIAALAKPYQP